MSTVWNGRSSHGNHTVPLMEPRRFHFHKINRFSIKGRSFSKSAPQKKHFKAMSRQRRSPFTIARNGGENKYYCFLTRNERIPIRSIDYPFVVSKVDEIEEDYIGAVITSFGIICVYLEQKIRVDLSMDGAIRLINPLANCSAVIDSTGQTVGLLHNSGRVLQRGRVVDIQKLDGPKAKMCSRGITFASQDSPIAYLLDEGGVKTTTNTYTYLDIDLTVDAFYSGAQAGKGLVGDCFELMQNAQHFVQRNSDTVWMINGVKITQNIQDEVYVSKDMGRHFLKTSNISGNIIAQTPSFYSCASPPPEGHLFVRQGERRIFAKDNEFAVRNGLQSAALDKLGRIKLY